MVFFDPENIKGWKPVIDPFSFNGCHPHQIQERQYPQSLGGHQEGGCDVPLGPEWCLTFRCLSTWILDDNFG